MEDVNVVEVPAPDKSLPDEEREFENQIAIFSAVLQNAQNPDTSIKGFNRDGEQPFEQKVSDFGDVGNKLDAARASLEHVRSQHTESQE